MRPTHAPAPRDRDFYRWATETAQAIRERSFTAVDWEAVAEELDDMGRSEQRELLSHLLKWQHPTGTPTGKELGLDNQGATPQDAAALEAKSRLKTFVGGDFRGGLRRRQAPGGP